MNNKLLQFCSFNGVRLSRNQCLLNRKYTFYSKYALPVNNCLNNAIIKANLLAQLPKTCPQIVQKRCFFPTSPKNALPPIVALLARPLAKLAAMLFGRKIRKWWQKLPQSERDKIMKKIRRNQALITFGFTLLGGVMLMYYIEHIEEAPLTKRKRFNLYNDEQMFSIAELEFQQQMQLHSKDIVPVNHPIYKRVVRVANRILAGNAELFKLKERPWSVTVIDRPDVTNAFVLPHGKIVLFTGILHIASNDDQLAAVLAHEMAHAILSHMTENLSKAWYAEMMMLLPLVLLWALLPDGAALFSQWVSSRLADIAIHLPNSRTLEMEADVVGLELAARACFDVREAPVFWAKMAQISDPAEPAEWLSTHPSNQTRQNELSSLMSSALLIRDKSHCPKLPPMTAAQFRSATVVIQ